MRTVEEMFRVDGKTALVTGGAGGIGLACAKALAAAGADLILSDIDGGRLDEAAEEIRRENGPSGGALCHSGLRRGRPAVRGKTFGAGPG